METIISGVISAIVSGIITGLIVAWFKNSLERTQKISDQNLDLRFKNQDTSIFSVRNEVVGVKNEVVAMKGSMRGLTMTVRELDKNVALVVQEQRHLNEKLEAQSNDFGKVIRR